MYEHKIAEYGAQAAACKAKAESTSAGWKNAWIPLADDLEGKRKP